MVGRGMFIAVAVAVAVAAFALGVVGGRVTASDDTSSAAARSSAQQAVTKLADEASTSPSDAPSSTASQPAGSAQTDPVMGSESALRTVTVRNDTNRFVTLHVSGMANYDWEGNRPDRKSPDGFENAGIVSGSEVSHALGKNAMSDGAPFTLTFADTGASVELQTKSDANHPLPNTSDKYTFAGWGLRNGDRFCGFNEVMKNGYRITVECRGVDATPNTLITIHAK